MNGYNMVSHVEFTFGSWEMNVELQDVMKRFSALEYSLAHGGPKHPKYPDMSIQYQVDELWKAHPELLKDEGFVEFIETYSGAVIIYPDDSIVVGINGLWDYTMHLLHDEGAYDGEHILFSEILLEGKQRESTGISGVAFAFKLSEMPCVYRRVGKGLEWMNTYPPKPPPYERYCDTFIEWLDKLVETEGLLID